MLRLLIALMLLSDAPEDAGVPADPPMRLEISGVRSSRGHVLLALYRSTDRFSEARATAFRKETLAAVEGTMAVAVEGLPPGEYAIALIHDENDNLKLDTGFLGLPVEGFCFSKGAMGLFGPPSFKAAAVAHEGATTVQRLAVKY